MKPMLTGGLRKARRGSETATVRAILDYLALKGILAWRQNSRVVMLPGKGGKERPYRMGGVKGMADIVGIVPVAHRIEVPGFVNAHSAEVITHQMRPTSYSWDYGRIGQFLAIEVKSATGKPTAEQLAFLQAVTRAGGLAFLARSVRDVQEHGL